MMRLIACFLLLTCLPCLQAGSLEVAPLKVTLSNQDKIQSISIRNLSELPIVVSLKVFDWQQNQKKDQYQQTSELLVTPPIITIPGKSEQVARLGMLKPLISDKEKAYRLYIHEVIDRTKETANVLQIALRVGIPVFVTPTQTVAENLSWEINRTQDNKLSVHVTNLGNQHATITKLTFANPDKSQEDFIKDDLFRHVLAGASYDWVFEVPNTFAIQAVPQITATTSTGDIKVEAAIEQS